LLIDHFVAELDHRESEQRVGAAGPEADTDEIRLA
jgi:hypothetical protein